MPNQPTPNQEVRRQIRPFGLNFFESVERKFSVSHARGAPEQVARHLYRIFGIEVFSTEAHWRELPQPGGAPEQTVTRRFFVCGWKVYESEELRVEEESLPTPKPRVAVETLTATELWHLYRDYVIREDTLINDRFQRMLIIQGFLITSFGIAAGACGKAFLDFFDNCSKAATGWVWVIRCAGPAFCAAFALITAATGALSAFMVKDGLEAAQEALDLLQARWNSYKEEADEVGLPGLRGAGSQWIHQRGHRHIVSFPTYLGIIWLVICVVTVAGLALAVSVGWAKFFRGVCM
jgi:hypothetical protein